MDEFRAWVEAVFGADGPAAPARREDLLRLFGEPEEWIDAYGDEQIAAGLWRLLGDGLASFGGDDAEMLDAVFVFHARVFAPRCAARLGHLDRGLDPPAPPLNTICYMFWDIAAVTGSTGALVDLFARLLALDSEACRESALHGLGHWHHRHPREVEAVVDDFLASNPAVSAALRAYAVCARRGHVL